MSERKYINADYTNENIALNFVKTSFLCRGPKM